MFSTTNSASVQGSLTPKPQTVRDNDSFFAWMRGVAEDRELSFTARLIGLRLALHRNADTGKCNPSYQKLADEIGVYRGTALRAVQLMVKRGWLADPDSSGGRSNNFVFLLPASGSSATVEAMNGGTSATVNSRTSATVETSTVAVAPLDSGTSATEQWHQRHPNDKLNEKGNGESDSPALVSNQSGSPKEGSSISEHFSTFWQLYPRRVGKLSAQRAFDKAVETGADPIAIIEGAQRYAEERAGEPERFTKHPTTWLNGHHWEDEPAIHGGMIIDELGNEIATRTRNTGNSKRSWAEVAAGYEGAIQ